MRLVLVAFVLAAVAIAAAPRLHEPPDDERAWPLPAVRVAALGRLSAAAELAWLKTIQLIGSADYERRGFPTLDDWLDVITSLDSSFEDPYFLGATLLVTDPARTPMVERLLARGEAAFPTVFSFPMLRGFLAQFGSLDPQAAAAHYRRASTMEHAPPYLAHHADRLEKEKASCSTVFEDLARMRATQSMAVGDRSGEIFEHCVGSMIRRAAVQYRLAHDNTKAATVEILVNEGLLEDPPRPPGFCWTIEHDRARLVPCPSSPGKVP